MWLYILLKGIAFYFIRAKLNQAIFPYIFFSCTNNSEPSADSHGNWLCSSQSLNATSEPGVPLGAFPTLEHLSLSETVLCKYYCAYVKEEEKEVHRALSQRGSLRE